MANARQPVDMVGVEVGEHQHRYRRDSGLVEAAVHRHRIRAGVDDHRLTRSDPEQQAVALADVAGDEHPTRGGQPGCKGALSSAVTSRAAARRQPPTSQQHRHDHAEPRSRPAAPARATGAGRPAPGAPGSSAPDVGDPDDQLGAPGGAEAGHRRQRGTDQGQQAAANPSTVAGPTKGPASALVGRRRRSPPLTCAATTGRVASWAARGTATASAIGFGNHGARPRPSGPPTR